MHIRNCARQRRHTRTAKHSSNDEAASSLSVPSQPAHSERHDCREDDALEKQRYVQHGHARVAALRDGRPDEYNAHREVEKEYPTWLDKVHDPDAYESTDSKGSLCSSEELRAQR